MLSASLNQGPGWALGPGRDRATGPSLHQHWRCEQDASGQRIVAQTLSPILTSSQTGGEGLWGNSSSSATCQGPANSNEDLLEQGPVFHLCLLILLSASEWKTGENLGGRALSFLEHGALSGYSWKPSTGCPWLGQEDLGQSGGGCFSLAVWFQKGPVFQSSWLPGPCPKTALISSRELNRLI